MARAQHGSAITYVRPKPRTLLSQYNLRIAFNLGSSQVIFSKFLDFSSHVTLLTHHAYFYQLAVCLHVLLILSRIPKYLTCHLSHSFICTIHFISSHFKNSQYSETLLADRAVRLIAMKAVPTAP
jgi:hypothetical protein